MNNFKHFLRLSSYSPLVKQISNKSSFKYRFSTNRQNEDPFTEKDLTLPNFMKILSYYNEQLTNSKFLENVIPRSFSSENDLENICSNLKFSKGNSDLKSITNALSIPIWDLLDRGGKRWRPILCIIIAELYGKQLNDILEIAALCELVHNGSLVVDDIEDNSFVRRDKECIHLTYGVDVCLNAGNFLYYIPAHKLLQSPNYSNTQKYEMMRIYTEEMVALHLGQGWDIWWHNSWKRRDTLPTEVQFLQMVSHKTGVLARMSTKLTGIVLNLDQQIIEKLSTFSETIGVAFQIQDDILNLEGEEYVATKGMYGEDIHEGKASLMVIHCLNNANQQDKDRLYEILTLKTKDQNLINEAINIIRKNGSIEYARQKSEELIQKAWNDVKQLLPNNNAKKKLELFAEFLITRKK